MALRVLALFLIACSAIAAAAQGPSETPVPVPSSSGDVEVYTATSPDHSITAHFMGEKFASNLEIPFGVHRVLFTFAGDPTSYPFHTDGVIAFTNWNTHVFSPSGDWVVLLKSQHGPFIVVSAKKLKDYLKGNAKPEKVLTAEEFEKGPPQGKELDYQFLQWTSYDGFLFAAICCGSEWQFDYQIPQKELKLAQKLPEQNQ